MKTSGKYPNCCTTGVINDYTGYSRPSLGLRDPTSEYSAEGAQPVRPFTRGHRYVYCLGTQGDAAMETQRTNDIAIIKP